jgi:hypothetical protein
LAGTLSTSHSSTPTEVVAAAPQGDPHLGGGDGSKLIWLNVLSVVVHAHGLPTLAQSVPFEYWSA